jgi:hypothetical protein
MIYRPYAQFFRHGDRVPSKYLYLPTDPQPRVPWPGDGAGALTLVGEQYFSVSQNRPLKSGRRRA